jgi:hypothetical protein
MQYLIVLPWVVIIILMLGISILLAGNIGKEPLFSLEIKDINEGNDHGWFWGMFALYPVWHSVLTYFVLKPGEIWISGYVFAFIVISISSLWLAGFYLFQWNLWKIVEVPIMIFLFILLPFIEFSDEFTIFGFSGSSIGGGINFIIFLLILLGARILKFFLWLVKPLRKPLFSLKKYWKQELHEKLYSKKAIKIMFLIWLPLGWLIMANVLIF